MPECWVEQGRSHQSQSNATHANTLALAMEAQKIYGIKNTAHLFQKNVFFIFKNNDLRLT